MTEFCALFEHAVARYLRGEIDTRAVHSALVACWHALRVHGRSPTHALAVVNASVRRAQRSEGRRLPPEEREELLLPLRGYSRDG